MKKLSILIALILIATIGGVYATWTYTGDNQVHTMSTKGVVMTDVSASTLDIGYYRINSNLSQGIIDQNKDSNPALPYHQAMLSYELKNGETVPTFSIEFIPSVGASDEIKDSGVITYLWFGAPGMTYDSNGDGTPEDIFGVTYGTDNYITIHPVGTDTEGMEGVNYCWTKTAEGFKFTFIGEGAPHDSFAAVFTLNDVVLDTESDYNAFKSSITKFIRGVVSNKVPADTVLNEEEQGS